MAWHAQNKYFDVFLKEQYPQDLSSITHIGLKPNPAQSDLLSPPTAKVLLETTNVSVRFCKPRQFGPPSFHLVSVFAALHLNGK